MSSLVAVIGAISLYVGLLVLIAVGVERLAARGRNLAGSAVVYSLSQAVYCTTWTYYGSVGLAASSGMLFLAIYLGPTLASIFGWSVLRRLVRLKNSHRLTGLADFVATRYGKSQWVGALATLMIVVGVVPYIALQLKMMIVTVAVVTGRGFGATAYAEVGDSVGPIIVALLILFTIAFGIRRISPAERHPGMMVALVVECVVKLVGFLAAGFFVVYGLFEGFGDVFRRALEMPAAAIPILKPAGAAGVLSWLAHLLLAASAILFLPRQFHVAVVENSDERHIRTSMWLLPLYLLAINLFVVPVALAGLLMGHSPSEADAYVLTLPFAAGEKGLALLVFLGGFSAGAGMVTIEAMAIATMISNHWLLPLVGLVRKLGFLRRHLLASRWVAAAGLFTAAFVYERVFGKYYALVSIGLISFAAVLQFAPAVLGGLYWRRANRVGAVLGLGAGFLVWAWTLAVPGFAKAHYLSSSLLENGPFGIGALRPEQLFGVAGLDPLTHAVVWTMLFNVGLFVVGSLAFRPGEREQREADLMVEALTPEAAALPMLSRRVFVDVAPKRGRVERFFESYYGAQEARRLAQGCLEAAAPGARERITVDQLAQLEAEVEKALAGSVGTAAAHAALQRESLMTPDESRELSRSYAEILAQMRVSPAELRQRVDYHAERERLLAKEATTNRLLAQTSRTLASSLDYETTLQAVVEATVPSFVDGCLLYVNEPAFDWARGSPRFLLAHTDRERAERAQKKLGQMPAPLSKLPRLDEAWRAGRVVVASPDSAAAWPLEVFGEIPIRSTITLPLVARRRVLGALGLFFSEQSTFKHPDDLAVAEELAHRCAMAIDNAALYRGEQDAVLAREEFMAVASHELKTPLTPLALQVQLLTRLSQRGELASVPPEKLGELLKNSGDQFKRLTRLVENLLDVSRITTGRLKLNLERTDLSEVAAEVVDRFRSGLAAAGCAIELETGAGVVGMWDRLRVEQVVTNLLDNARKYASSRPLRVRTSAEGARALLVVQDQGIGIAREDQERIFQPFERAVPFLKAGGLGLGLYIVRQIVEAHGGTIHLQSEPRKGSTFTVELPRLASG